MTGQRCRSEGCYGVTLGFSSISSRVYSAVSPFPHASGETTLQYLKLTTSTRPGEVLYIDEKEYRQNMLSVKLLGRGARSNSVQALTDAQTC